MPSTHHVLMLMFLSSMDVCSAQDRMTYKQNFIKELKGMPIAIVTQKPNEQHYEVPPEFFKLVLGARLKYSASLYNDGMV